MTFASSAICCFPIINSLVIEWCTFVIKMCRTAPPKIPFRQMDGQRGMQTDRQTDGQTDRQTYIEVSRRLWVDLVRALREVKG